METRLGGVEKGEEVQRISRTVHGTKYYCTKLKSFHCIGRHYTWRDGCTQPTKGGTQNGSSVGICTRCIHVFASLVLICKLSRCLVTKFLHRSSVGSLLRVRCWLGSSTQRSKRFQYNRYKALFFSWRPPQKKKKQAAASTATATATDLRQLQTHSVFPKTSAKKEKQKKASKKASKEEVGKVRWRKEVFLFLLRWSLHPPPPPPPPLPPPPPPRQIDWADIK